MRPRIFPNRRDVKWLSASCRTKCRVCRIRRPPVLNSRCWRLVFDPAVVTTFLALLVEALVEVRKLTRAALP